MTGPRILFYVQYLEGIGHAVRARRIVEELCRNGCQVVLVLGGNVIPGFTAGPATIHQLPPLSASPRSYSKLLQADGSPADEDFLASRRDQLLGLHQDFLPDIIITEAYPMGRWAMAFELEPLLVAAAKRKLRPMIVASLRDILQMPKTNDKVERSIEIFKQYYDLALVHGDRQLARIEESFPPIGGLLDQVHYTGIVAPALPPLKVPLGEAFDVIVSGGGGAIGYEVLKAAIEAKPATQMARAQWLALAGPRMPQDAYRSLCTLARARGVKLERFRDNLTALMSRAELSIQRAGYNTVADLLIAGCRGVLVPDAADRQMEQPMRAARLAELGRVAVVEETGLSAQTMSEGIDRSLALSPIDLQFDLNGATRSAELIRELFAHYQAIKHPA